MFLVVEGPDGVGKTTAGQMVVAELNSMGRAAMFTTEPSDSLDGLALRTYLRNGGASKEALLELFLKDRRQHVEQVIVPTVARGIVVVCDRYKYSTVCYQHLQGFPIDELVRANDFPSPDLTAILLVPPSVIMRRLALRADAPDVFENEATINAAHELFQRMPALFPREKFRFIDASRPVDAVVKELLACVTETTLAS